MKKAIVLSFALFAMTMFANAQKFALVDMDYVMSAIPAYETANEQLSQLSSKWQKEVEALLVEAQTMYKNYQTELPLLSDEMKKKYEEEIVAKEKEAEELKRKYFGPEGEHFKKRESLIKPIQDEIYNAIQELCEAGGYQMILDKASSSNLIYAAPKLDVSDDLLEKLGYSK